jgi:Esterase-like activity of phytase
MRRNLLLASALLAAFGSTAHAAVDLVATGSVSGAYEDFASDTAASLENGVPGNRLGGMGSALAYAGCNTFVALPDRGPNAVTYDPTIDNTASYIPRFHTLRLTLAKSDAGAALPYTLTPFVLDTTLLSSVTPLRYTVAPPLNQHSRLNYFTGRSDAFDPQQPSTNPRNGRLDPEGIRVSNDGRSVFVTDEYGPYLYQFDRSSGVRLRSYSLPAKFAVTNLSPIGNTEISGNTSGRVANKGMEGLALTPDGRTLVGIMQSPLIQDGGTDGPITRIVTVDVRSGAVHEYGYELTNIGTTTKPKYPTVSEILAVNGHEFLVDERDGKGLGDDSKAAFKQISHIDLNGAIEISGLSGATQLAGKAVPKTLFLDVVAKLTAVGFATTDIPAKLEGIAFGADLDVDGVRKHTLVVSNDNDYLGTITDTGHPTGIDNPNRWFVFAVDASDLPTFAAQPLETSRACNGDDHHIWEQWGWF